MSYLVLARKYRPSTFSEVVGQEHVTRTLTNAFASGRVHHAFLFCGPRGCGKTTLARIVGRVLNCERRDAGAGAVACGPDEMCSACTSISNGSAVDYQEMDGASNRGIDAIRELTEAVRYQPAVLRKKVYVIDEVHMLTTEAFNALLKTLEEPPPHVTFVLATTEPHKLPNTILSRCQRYDFKLVAASRLGLHLSGIFKSEKLAVEAGAISLLVRESGGSVRDALSLSDQVISYVGETTITEQLVSEVLGVADRSLTRALVRALASGDAGAALSAVESAIDRGVDEVQLARAIVRYLRDLSVLQVAPDRPELIDATDEDRAELLAESRELERSRVTLMFDRMLRCCDELGKTLQPRLVLDCALIDVATVEPLVPLGDLIERLGDLEARLSGRGAVRPASPPSGGGVKKPAFATGTVAGAPKPATPAPAEKPPAARTEQTQPRPLAAPTPVPVEKTTSNVDRTAPMPALDRPPARPAQAFAAGTAPGTDKPPVMAVPEPAPAVRSAPVSMQPSGPVPKAETVASGSEPHDEAPAIGLPKTPSAVLEAWGKVLGALEARKKFSLLGPFQHARVMKWTAEDLELGFPVDVHSMGEMASDREVLDDLRSLVRELGPEMKAIKLHVRLLDASESDQGGVRSVLETTRERTTAERSKREAEAREHPITKHVLTTFGAQIKEIKTDV